jgi:pyrophosphate--fructose-6-phosphate 1-phosphotransferase
MSAIMKSRVLAGAIATNSDQVSELQQERLNHTTDAPKILKVPHVLVDGEERNSMNNNEVICALFPHLTGDQGPLHLVHLEQCDPSMDPEGGEPLRIGLVLSGGQAAGGHNVIWGLYEYLRHRHPGSTLYGFLDGPRGVMEKRYKEITAEELNKFRNMGGFHLLGSGRDKIEKPEQIAQAAASCADLKLNGLIVVGGDDSNTNACVLAENFLAQGSTTTVVGVPKTMDGDLKCADVPISFGFDTACKVFSELVGNIMIDSASARKYWHFIRLMGRSASHVTLEVALQTHPNWAFISEELASAKISLKDVANKVADIVAARSAAGRNYGVVLLPEGLIENVHDFATLISELNDLMAAGSVDSENLEQVAAALSPESRELFNSLSIGFQREFLGDRDPHGNVQVSHIETEKLLIRMVETELESRAAAGTFTGKFNGLGHFFGYEGRCALPSNFDSAYCFSLGAAAGALSAAGKTGVMAAVSDLHKPAAEWRVGGVPLVSMMHMEHRSGKQKPVIAKALVELDGQPMVAYKALRDHWALHDCFRSPGPIQFKGHEWADVGSITLALEINNGDPIMLKDAPEVIHA